MQELHNLIKGLKHKVTVTASAELQAKGPERASELEMVFPVSLYVLPTSWVGNRLGKTL